MKKDSFMHSVYNPVLCSDYNAFNNIHGLAHDFLIQFVKRSTPDCRKAYPNNAVKVSLKICFITEQGQEVIVSKGCDLILEEKTVSVCDDFIDKSTPLSKEQRKAIMEWFDKLDIDPIIDNTELGPVCETEVINHLDQLIEKKTK